MAITNSGYAGTTDEVQWARSAEYFGDVERVVSGFTGTTVAAGTRQSSWAAGVAYSKGVTATSNAAEVVSHAAVTTGTRWDTVVLRRDWQFDTGVNDGMGLRVYGRTTVFAVPGGTAEAVAGGLLSNPGVFHDQPIGLVQVTAGALVPTAVRNLTSPPRHDLQAFAYALTGTTLDYANQPAGEEWPQQAAVNVYVPRWATTVHVIATWAGVANASAANTRGSVWTRLDTIDLNATRYWPVVAEQNTMTLHAAASLTLPAALKGRVVRLAPRATGPATGPALLLDNVSSVSMFADFKE